MKPSLLPARSLGAEEVRALAHPLRLGMLCASRETAFVGGRTVDATRPEPEHEPGTPLGFVTYRALPQTPTAE